MLKKIDGFIISLLFVISFAYFFPYTREAESVVSLKLLADIGISLIFFFYGLKLSPEELKKDLSNWRLHIMIQISTFVIFPLITLIFLPFATTSTQFTIWLAIFFLSVLPSTVSSSVVMVSIAKGNITGAIFNASLSGLLGIACTPLWMGLFLGKVNGDFDYMSIISQLFINILLPVILGLLLHKHLGYVAIRIKGFLSYFDKSVILLIVYKSFSASFAQGIFSGIPVGELILLFIFVVGLFWFVYGLMYMVSRILKFSSKDTTTLLFCGSKKSLMHGSVFSKVLFANSASSGIFLLPIMIYHAFQLLIISFIARKRALLE